MCDRATLWPGCGRFADRRFAGKIDVSPTLVGRFADKFAWTLWTFSPSSCTPPLPIPSLLYPSFLLPWPSLPSFLSSIPLYVGPLKSSYVWGSSISSEINLVHFSFKIWHLVATLLMIFPRINLTKRKPDVVDLFSYFRGPFFLYAVNRPYFLVDVFS